MFVSRVALKNWRNFSSLDVRFREVTYVLGANAAGKSNLIDVFRFLRDIAMPSGGGLQRAVEERGGMSKLRCLHARSDPGVRIEVDFVERTERLGNTDPDWRYVLEIKETGRVYKRCSVVHEAAYRGGKLVAPSRPTAADGMDSELLTQTHLEQIQANKPFRQIKDLFDSTSYLHLVPQLVRYPANLSRPGVMGDPFGEEFLSRIATTAEKLRAEYLKRISNALTQAVPFFDKLEFERDEAGRPHLRARYKHFRPRGGWQREDQFSDGTLRLIGLLWSLMERRGLLLLEEPELSLNDSIVELLVERV